MNIKQKIASAVAFGTMMVSVVAPASFAATNTVTVTGNGAFSYTKAVVKNISSTATVQENTTAVNTWAGLSANTGKNKQSFNVGNGGSNSITTGPATNIVGISVTGGTNTNTSPCGCAGDNTNTVTVTGGGAFSSSKAVVINSNSTVVSQTNTTAVNTNVWSSANTGGNSQSFNVGGGNSVTTDPASNTVGVEVGGSTNTN